MTPDDLQKRAVKLLGRGWKPLLAKELGVHLSAVYRWLPCREKPPQSPVPNYVVVCLDMIEYRKRLERIAKGLVK